MELKEFITFDGVSTKEFNIWTTSSGTFSAPERDVSKFTVQGRSGDLVIDNQRYKNREAVYPAMIYDAYQDNIESARDFFLEHSQSYYRLEDTMHPDEYVMARYAGGFDVSSVARNSIGKFNLKFDCKPQRYLKSGEKFIDIISNGTVLKNPTNTEALPIIRVYGYGDLFVGTDTITIAQHATPYIDIDSELQDAYYGAQNMNAYVTVTNFPKLKGKNTISFSGYMGRVDIKPRWWRL